MKKLILITSIFLSCNTNVIHNEGFKYSGYETDDTNYYAGEVLLPDMVHSDTLIVVNADSLNWCMANYDIASDGDINDVLGAYCTKK